VDLPEVQVVQLHGLHSTIAASQQQFGQHQQCQDKLQIVILHSCRMQSNMPGLQQLLHEK
jgi:hypothetical protein